MRRLAALAWLAAAVAPAGAASLALEPCRLAGVEHELRCGRLERPLDPARPQGPKIDLHVAVLPALARRPREDAVFFFAGGPGQSAIDLAGHVAALLARFGNRRDIVLVDQRGTGRSAPLACDRPPDEWAPTDAQVAQLLACRDALARRPHLRSVDDLRHFTTPIAATDVDAVRRALGLQRVNLVGVSYGTRLAIEVMRQFPQTVRRAVLDGVAPPDMALPQAFAVDAQTALDALFAWCDADAACRDRHPQLRARWRAALSRLPASTDVPDPLGGAPRALTLTRESLAGALRLALYSPLLASALPHAIDEAAAGRWVPMVGLAQALAGGARAPAVAAGAHFSVICAEDLPRVDTGPDVAAADAGAAFDVPFAQLYRRVCAGWPRGEVPAAFYAVPPSPAPVLLLSGGIDPVTPPRHGERVRAALGPLARHVVVPNAGHGVLALACVRDAVFRFVDADAPDDALRADADCARELPRPPVWVPIAASAP